MGQVGRYRLLHRLGRGGMAEVVAAVAIGQDGFERRVAIKRMLPGRDTGSSRRMFVDEARIASHLHHANIVGVLDFGIADEVPFQVLELVEGEDALSLSDRGRELGTPLPDVLALHVCTEVAHALGHAHAACDTQGRNLGIVHRDVKPTNILLSWDGDVKLTDFGVAFAWNRTERTSLGIAKGTRLYMSPEQAMGLPPDARSDLFSLGCTLHALVTGRSPLEDSAALARMLSGQPPPLDPALPADVRSVVERATRFRREERYPDAEAMASDLGRLTAARLEGDARTALRQWVSRLRPDAPRARGGDLDALFDVEMVLSSSGEDDAADPGVRHFVTDSTLLERKAPGAPAVPEGTTERLPAPAAPEASTVVTSLPVRRRWPLAVAGIAALGLGAVAVWTLGDAENEGGPTVATWAPPPGPARPSPQQAMPPPTAREPALPEGAAVPEGAAPAEVPTRQSREPPHAPQSAAATPRTAPDPPAPTPAAAAAVTGVEIREGVLVVGGAGAQRAELIVDGRSVGFAPKRLTVSLGPHRVELVQPGGQRVGPQTVVVEARHTVSAPARWIVP